MLSKIDKCKSASDIRIMIKENELRPLKGRISKEEYIKLWLDSEETAKRIWQHLLKKNEKFFNKYGYLEIEYIGNGKYRRKPLPKGQPPKEHKKEKELLSGWMLNLLIN